MKYCSRSSVVAITFVMGLVLNPLFVVGGNRKIVRSNKKAVSNTKQPDAINKAKVEETYGQLPISFEKNEGQFDSQVKFLSKGEGYSLFLTPTEAIMSVMEDKKEMDKKENFSKKRNSKCKISNS